MFRTIFLNDTIPGYNVPQCAARLVFNTDTKQATILYKDYRIQLGNESLAAQMTELSTTVINAVSGIPGLNERVDQITNSLYDQITGLQIVNQRLDDQETGLSAINSNIGIISSKLNDAETGLDAANQHISAISGDLYDQITGLNAANQNIESLSTQLTDQASGLQAVYTFVDGISATVMNFRGAFNNADRPISLSEEQYVAQKRASQSYWTDDVQAMVRKEYVQKAAHNNDVIIALDEENQPYIFKRETPEQQGQWEKLGVDTLTISQLNDLHDQIDNRIDTVNNTLNTLIEEISGHIGTVFEFKGVVNTKEDLYNIQNPTVGDVYIVKEYNLQFAYSKTEDPNGSWIELGPESKDLYNLSSNVEQLSTYTLSSINNIEQEIDFVRTQHSHEMDYISGTISGTITPNINYISGIVSTNLSTTVRLVSSVNSWQQLENAINQYHKDVTPGSQSTIYPFNDHVKTGDLYYINDGTDRGYIFLDNNRLSGKFIGIQSGLIKADYDSQIQNEASRAAAVESAINNNLTSEIARATAAESAINTALADEVTRATTEEQTINSALTAEVSRATTAESTIDNKVNDEILRATTNEQTISDALTAEVSRAESAEAEINEKVDQNYREITESIEQTVRQVAQDILSADYEDVNYKGVYQIDTWNTMISGTPGQVNPFNPLSGDLYFVRINQLNQSGKNILIPKLFISNDPADRDQQSAWVEFGVSGYTTISDFNNLQQKVDQNYDQLDQYIDNVNSQLTGQVKFISGVVVTNSTDIEQLTTDLNTVSGKADGNIEAISELQNNVIDINNTIENTSTAIIEQLTGYNFGDVNFQWIMDAADWEECITDRTYKTNEFRPTSGDLFFVRVDSGLIPKLFIGGNYNQVVQPSAWVEFGVSGYTTLTDFNQFKNDVQLSTATLDTKVSNNYDQFITSATNIITTADQLASTVAANHQQFVTTTTEIIQTADQLASTVAANHQQFESTTTNIISDVDLLKATVNANHDQFVTSANNIITAADQLASTVDSINGRVTTNETNIDSINGHIGTIDITLDEYNTRITTNEQDISTIKSDITNINSDIADINSAITTMSGKLFEYKGIISSLELLTGDAGYTYTPKVGDVWTVSEVVVDGIKYNNVQYICTSIETPRGEWQSLGFQDNLSAIISEKYDNVLSTQLTQLSTHITLAYEAKIQDLNSEFENKYQALSAKYDVVTDQLAQITGIISVLTGLINN